MIAKARVRPPPYLNRSATTSAQVSTANTEAATTAASDRAGTSDPARVARADSPRRLPLLARYGEQPCLQRSQSVYSLLSCWRGHHQVLQLAPSDLDAVSLSGYRRLACRSGISRPRWRAHGEPGRRHWSATDTRQMGWVRPMGCVSVGLRGNGTRAVLSECLNLRVDTPGSSSPLLVFAAIAGDVVRRAAE